MAKISFDEDDHIAERLDWIAEQEGTSRSALIRRAIRQLLFSIPVIPENGNKLKTENQPESPTP